MMWNNGASWRVADVTASGPRHLTEEPLQQFEGKEQTDAAPFASLLVCGDLNSSRWARRSSAQVRSTTSMLRRNGELTSVGCKLPPTAALPSHDQSQTVTTGLHQSFIEAVISGSLNAVAGFAMWNLHLPSINEEGDG